MAMLLRTRTRKVALGLRIICICTVSFVYLVIALLSNSISNPHAVKESSGYPMFTSRHLLALNSINDSNPGQFNEIFDLKPSTLSWNESRNCTPAALNEFPSDGLTREQRQHGWVIIHVIVVCYLFIFLAVVCDDYFVPCIKKLCDVLQLKEDIAGATFMATASSSAEIFVNSVGTFITEGDLGLGTIVGSAVFNILAVPACCGFFGNMAFKLEWFALTRDSAVYGCAVIILICFLQDGIIYYSEALTLMVLYLGYLLVMVFNDTISSWFHRTIAKLRNRGFYKEVMAENQPLLLKANEKLNNNYSESVVEFFLSDVTLKDIEQSEESTNIWSWPKEDTKKTKLWWIFTWPISFVLFLTTPTIKKYPKMYIVTFAMCVAWIGTVSYVVAWLITIIGDTLNIPDSVMGLTFLAAGTSVPEAVSSVLVTNQGYGSMGISSSIGSNTFDILLCLGLPWFIKSAFYPKVPGQHWITINSQGINYSAVCLLTTLVLFYLSICFNKFQLDWKIGLVCLVMYVGFVIFATLVELNVFFIVNLPTCSR
ncbi:hypothetical protein HUJ04_002751 [Dendroctonus ponderosae]|uniref:Sodium/calcium exchanger membrane region domain-containing protein n=2 Tax=Dendroctonus ponderosae TaxID=77166 RepID=A0AAR5QJ87_DENPD|nr:hypothetical protein HUJ04_002751 [Dendroctonus ponderosae]